MSNMAQSPAAVLVEKAKTWGVSIESTKFAKLMDEEDPLGHLRNQFCIPKKKDLPYLINDESDKSEDDCLYFCGQSLGLKPKAADDYVNKVLQSWGQLGVLHHFNGYLPAALCDLPAKEPMARMVGGKPEEVSIMNGLTVNLHVLLNAFYKPTAGRHKIIIEENAFPSDMYAVKSQIELHGYKTESSLLCLKRRPGEHLYREEDIVELIEREGDTVALILIFGLHYYSGQLINIPMVTSVCHSKGITVGVDCAHAVGNVPLSLHDWDVDFAAWCTYKYLNAGAGSVGGLFVHEKFMDKDGNLQIQNLKGWWGNKLETRFLMSDEFDPAPGADVFRFSNPPPLLNATLMASLDIFDQVKPEDRLRKQFLITGYLEYLIKLAFVNPSNSDSLVQIITPSDPSQRGSMLSLVFKISLANVKKELENRGVVVDIRLPDVMRVTPVPLYTSFMDVNKFVSILKEVVLDCKDKPSSDTGVDIVLEIKK